MRNLITISFCILFSISTHSAWCVSNDEPIAIDSNNIRACSITPIDSAAVNASFSDQFLEFFTDILATNQWPARWYCGTWSSFDGWVYILSDVAIWLAYFMIPFVLAYFLYKRRLSTPYTYIFVLFIGFILACGLTHLIDAVIFWWPAYRLSALIRFATAAVSLATVFALVKVVPDALKIPGSEDLYKEISQRKKAEQELADKLRELETINNELESFSYSVSHDLRSPLRTINGFTQALVEDYRPALNDEAKGYLDRVSAASERMSNLIDDILELSRISRQNFVVSEIDLTRLAHEVVQGFKGQMTENTTISIADNMKAMGDVGLLRIVLENLLGNSIKYSRTKEHPIIEIGQTESKGEKVFYIKDNGVGFDMDYIDKIFGPFQRLHSNNEFEGTGIGLATVLRIINRHNGKIWAESTLGEGATFYFKISAEHLF